MRIAPEPKNVCLNPKIGIETLGTYFFWWMVITSSLFASFGSGNGRFKKGMRYSSFVVRYSFDLVPCMEPGLGRSAINYCS